MKIKIREGAGRRHHGSFGHSLTKLEGLWVDVDTKHLFTDQFNILEVSGITRGSIRINTKDTDGIEDDARLGKSKCKICTGVFITGDPCKLCGTTSKRYIEELVPGSSMRLGIQETMSRSLKKCFAQKEIEF